MLCCVQPTWRPYFSLFIPPQCCSLFLHIHNHYYWSKRVRLPNKDNPTHSCVFPTDPKHCVSVPLGGREKLIMICLDVRKHTAKRAPFVKRNGASESSFSRVLLTEKEVNLVAEGLEHVISPQLNIYLSRYDLLSVRVRAIEILFNKNWYGRLTRRIHWKPALILQSQLQV